MISVAVQLSKDIVYHNEGTKMTSPDRISTSQLYCLRDVQSIYQLCLQFSNCCEL